MTRLALALQPPHLVGNRLCVPPLLAACHEHDIALARVGVGVFEKEKLVDAVVLQRRRLGNRAERAGKGLFNDEVFLAANLSSQEIRTEPQRGAGTASDETERSWQSKVTRQENLPPRDGAAGRDAPGRARRPRQSRHAAPSRSGCAAADGTRWVQLWASCIGFRPAVTPRPTFAADRFPRSFYVQFYFRIPL